MQAACYRRRRKARGSALSRHLESGLDPGNEVRLDKQAPLLSDFYRGRLVVIYVQNMATREVRNKLDKQRQYRKARDRYERNETEPGSSVSKRRRMNSEFVEKWDAAALKVISCIVWLNGFCAGFGEHRKRLFERRRPRFTRSLAK